MQLSVEVQALHVASTNGGEVGAGLGLVSSVVLRWDGHCLQLLALPGCLVPAPLAACWCLGCLCLRDQVQDVRSTTETRENATTTFLGPVCLSAFLPAS